MRIINTTLILFLFCNSVYGQNPLVKIWDYRFGGDTMERLTSLQQTFDGGYILGGFSYSNISGDKTQPNWDTLPPLSPDYWIIKIDSIGNKQWDKRFGGLTSDALWSLKQTTDRGFILGGYGSDSSGDVSHHTNGGIDYWIIKIDSSGNKQWDKNFGGASDDWFVSLTATKDGGYLLGGASRSDISGDKTQPNRDTTGNTPDYWIIKIDSLGNKEWDRTYGGTGDDELKKIKETTYGDFVLAGWSTSGLGGDKTQLGWGNYEYWIVKTDSLGNKIWDRDFGSINPDLLSTMQIASDGEYVFAGDSYFGISGNKSQAGVGAYDYWIIKTDTSGNIQWDKTFGGGAVEELQSIEVTNDRGFLISGESYSSVGGDKTENNLGLEQAWILKIDSLGIKEWDKTVFTYGHDEDCISIQSTDGCYVTANETNSGIGGYKSQANWGSYDFWIIKFCDTTVTTSIQIVNQVNSIEVYPNPANDKLNVTVNNKELSEFILFDMAARKLIQQKFINSVTLITEQLAKGIYFYEVRSKDGSCKKGKVVKD